MIDKYTAQAPTTEEAIEKGLKALALTRDEAIIEVVEEGKKGFLGLGQRDAVVTVRRKETKSLLDQILPQNPEQDQPKETESPVSEEPAEPEIKESVEPEAAVEETERVQPEVVDTEAEDWDEEDEEEFDEELSEHPETVDDQTAIQKVNDYLKAISEVMGAGPVDVEIEQEGSRVYFNMTTKKAGIIIGHHGKVLNALQSLAQVQLHKYASRKLTAIVDAEGYRKRREETLRNLANRTAKKVSRTKQPVVLEPMPAFERKLIHRVLSASEDVTTHSEGKEPHRYLVVEPIIEKKTILNN
ncbi:RNA-binding cell elongation regulator Jag/EloR [Atopococcus tabaci]|uniref:RNA-binding cell elongation regulator Jag/EloR n=1 Tax=Atopococcus tabaci TaxID=269774 RepID=UPI00240973A8|nr:RNA-binding cell elongation regulator Jag/EloR [Atopococcus tabaci]